MTVLLLPGYEDIVDALVARFQAELAAAVARVNALDTKGITLEDFDTTAGILDYVPPPTQLNHFPCVAIQDGPHILTDDVGWGATGNTRLIVVVFVQDGDQQRLATKLRRYVRIVRSVALNTRQLSNAWIVNDGGTKPGPTIGEAEGARTWMSWSATTLEFRSEQDGT